jgi:hypothetical protein
MMKQETKVIKTFLKKIGASKIKVRSVNIDTQADMNNNIIFFNKKDFEDKKMNKIIKGYYNSIGHKDIKVHMGTYAILHELGHILSKMEIKNFDKTFSAYVNGTNKVSKIKNEKVKFYKYRNLRMEKLADKYAYLVYKMFEKQTIKFDKKLQKFCE